MKPTSELPAAWPCLAETSKGQKTEVSRTRTVLIDKPQHLVYAVPVTRAPYTINSELEAPLVAEIEALKIKDVY